MKPLHREVERVLALYGIRPEIKTTNGNHVRFTWKIGDHVQKLVCANSPSDHRALKNEAARVRRMLRQAGVTKIAPIAEPPPPQSSPPIVPREPLSLEDRIAHLERDVRTLMDLLTDPQRKQAMLTPPPPPASPPPTKRRGLHWIFRALRYDDFLPMAVVAAAAGKPRSTTSVALTKFKNRGLIEHQGKGWRKHRKVEQLLNGHAH